MFFFIIKQLSEKILTMQVIIAETDIDSEHSDNSQFRTCISYFISDEIK